MNIDSIVGNLYKSPDLNSCIAKMVKPDHQQDFKQELFLLLYQKPHELLLSLYNSSGLTYYVVRIILNLVNQKRNVYHKTYNDFAVTYDSESMDRMISEDDNFTERIQDEEKELQLLSEIDSMDEKLRTPQFRETPYYRHLVYLISQHKSQRAVSRLTGIPVSSISESVKRVRKHLIKCCTP